MKHTVLVVILLIVVTAVSSSCGWANPMQTKSPEVETPNMNEKDPTALVPQIPNSSEEVPSASPPEILLDTELPPSSYLPEVPRIGIEEVKKKLDAAYNIIIVDSRSKASYDRSHILGAISIPLADIVEPYDDLANYDEVIFY